MLFVGPLRDGIVYQGYEQGSYRRHIGQSHKPQADKIIGVIQGSMQQVDERFSKIESDIAEPKDEQAEKSIKNPEQHRDCADALIHNKEICLWNQKGLTF